VVSLRKREKSSILDTVQSRVSKMPIVLDPSDFVIQLERAVRKLDELLFNPRSIILTDASSGLVDVTSLYIDEICTVYYSEDSLNSLLGGMDLGVGIMPILSSQGMPLSSLESSIDYLILKGVLNTIQRKMLNTWDYTLMPIDAEGRQFLQVKNPGNLLWVEYLPYLDPSKDSWDLYENEFSFLQELLFAYICHANAEIQMQVSLLGVGKEAANLVTFWEQKIDKIIKEFTDSTVLSYMG